MKPWLESILFNAPLRSVRCHAPDPLAGETRRWQAVRENAAYQRGCRDGERALSEQLLQQRSELSRLQSGVLTSLERAVPDLLKRSEPLLIELALAAASRLVNGLPITPGLVEAAVSEAIAQSAERHQLKVLLHPSDLNLLKEIESPLLNPSGESSVRFVPDPSISPGGCVVETSLGTIDNRRETRLETLRQNLLTA